MAALSGRPYLTPLSEPALVAVVGATGRAGAVGAVLIRNLLAKKGELGVFQPAMMMHRISF